MKKILALVVAMLLVAGMVSAFAADDGTITISNTTQDAAYNIYKVFDATYSGSNVAYFYDGSNTDFLAALQDNASPFELTGPVNGVYNVIRKDGVPDANVIDFIKDQVGHFGSVVQTLTGNGASVTASGLPYGYYYITSSVGSTVTINSALKDVTVIDKNQETTLDKEEKVANGTWVYDGPYSDDITPPTGNVGDTVEYKVEGTWTRYVGEDIVKTLKWHDVMSSGLTADQNVVVKFGDQTLNRVDSNPGNGQYTVTYTLNNNGTDSDTTDDYWETNIVVPVATISEGVPTFFYNVTNPYVITYSAKIDQDAVIDGVEENTVDLKYTDQNDNDQDVGSDKTKVKDFPLHLLKKDGKNTEDTTDDSLLAGAKFKLYPVTNPASTTAIKVVLIGGDGTATSATENVYRLAEAGETTNVIEEMVVGATGQFTVKGLANGSYHFEETEAPAGFNKLTSRTDVATITNDEASITAINNSGTTLPSTGGVGTTIFYVVGGILVLGAVIFLVTKRRMGSND